MDLTPYMEDLDLASVTGREELSALLRTVHARADRPSLRALEARSRHGQIPLSKTVVSEMLKGARFPRKAVMLGFLQACGVHDDDLEPWQRAWERIAVSEQGPAGTRSPAAPGRQGDGEDAGRAFFQEHGPDASTRLAPRGTSSGRTEPARKGQPREQVSQYHSASERQPPAAAGDRRAVRKEYPAADPAIPGPTVRKRELGVLLHALRAEKGMTVEQAAEHLMC